MARIELPQNWLLDLVTGAEQQAQGDAGKQGEIIGRAVGKLIGLIWVEDSRRATNILAVLNRAVNAEDIKLR